MSRGFEYYRAWEATVEGNRVDGKLEVPVQAWGSEMGIGMGLKVSIEGIATRLEGGVLEDCGHYAMEERPERVGELVEGFVARVEGRV